MKILFGIIGAILLLPIAIVIVAAIATTLVGAYIWLVFEICGWVLVVIGLIIGIVWLVKRFT